MHGIDLPRLTRDAALQGRRLVAPFLGFPGAAQTGLTPRIAQQNHAAHFRVVKGLAQAYRPDIIFPLMDRSVEANALGRTAAGAEDGWPAPDEPFSLGDLPRLEAVDLRCDSRILAHVETVKLMRLGLPDEAIKGAFVSAPFDLAAQLMGVDQAVEAVSAAPEKLEPLCAFAMEVCQTYMEMLIAAGAGAVCILEPHGSRLDASAFARYSAPYVRRLAEICQDQGVAPILHVCGDSGHLVGDMARTGVQALSLDSERHGVRLPEVAGRLPEDMALIGNVDPVAVLHDAGPEQVFAEVTRLITAMAHVPCFILGTACALPPGTPAHNIRAFMEAGRVAATQCAN
jgi:uroporphyrinogen decarboxylase